MLVGTVARGRRGGRRSGRRRLSSDLQKELAAQGQAFVSDGSASSSAEDSCSPSPATVPRPDWFAGTLGATSSRSTQRSAKANKMGPEYKLGEPGGRGPWTPSEWLEAPIFDRKQEKEKKLMRPLLPELHLRDFDQQAQARAHTCPHCGCSNHHRVDQAAELSPTRHGGSGSRPMSRQTSKSKRKPPRTGTEDPLEEQLEAGSLWREGSHQNWKKEEAPRRASCASSITAKSTSGRRKTRVLSACAAVWLACGMLFFWSEGYGLVDSMYSLTQIITTVGYGDIVPKTNYQKITTAIVVLSSTLLMAGICSHVIDAILDAQADALIQSLHAKEEEIKSSQSAPTNQQKDAKRSSQVEVSRLEKLKMQAVIHASIFVCFIVAGTVFFGIFESCACPEDSLGCHLDPNACEDSGGVERSFVDTFYMSVVTITTVGYGDMVPQTQIGRITTALYMLFGVGSTLNLVGTVTDLLKEMFESDERVKMTKESFIGMDMDNDGNLDRHEFLRLQLIMLGLAQEGELNSIDLQFDLIDSSGDGVISRDEFHNFYLL